MYWRTLDGLRLPASLDSITSPYTETAKGGRGSPANLISEITNLCVVHHLELISVAWEGRSALLEGASITRHRRRLRLLQDGRRRKTSEKEAADLDPREGSGRCEAERTGFK